MIRIVCSCGTCEDVPESEVGAPRICPSCQKVTNLACGETLPEDAGAGDFDTQLTVVSGPANVEERYLLGGVAPIQIGKLPDNHIVLSGHRVSRHHCVLERIDFGPSRWRIKDKGSTHGVLLNDQKIAEQELSPGDMLQLGDFTLRFEAAPGAEAQVPEAAIAQAAAAQEASAPAPAAAPALAYASAPPDAAQVEPNRPLGICDINWVMQIRNGARLLSYAAIPIVVGRFVCGIVTVIALPISALLAGVAGWFLSAKEPHVPENIIWTAVRLMLKVTGAATGLAIPMIIIGGVTGNMPLLFSGGICALAIPVYVLLTMLYIFRLARRLPNNALAVCSLLVAIGLSTTMGFMVYAMFAAVSAAQAPGSTPGNPLEDISLGMAYWLMYLFTWCYMGILFWFNRSFS